MLYVFCSSFVLCCLLPVETMKLYCFMSVLSTFFFVNKTRWFSCLHLVVLFLVCCFEFLFSFLSKKAKTDTTKPPPQNQKVQKQKNKAVFQLAQLCSQMVFLIFRGGLQHANFCLKRYKICLSAYMATTKNGQKVSNFKVKHWSTHKSKTGPRMLSNIIWPVLVVNFDLFVVLFCKSRSPCRKKSMKKIKKRETNKQSWTSCWPLKRKILDQLFFSTVYIYIYIYMYAVELLSGPSLAILGVIIWAKFA